jgi:hypothetical protein
VKEQAKEKAGHDEDGPGNRRFSRTMALQNALFYQVRGGLAVALFTSGKTEGGSVRSCWNMIDSDKRSKHYNFPFNHSKNQMKNLNANTMKTRKLVDHKINIMIGIFVLGVILPFTSCAQKIKFLPSSVVPAANGYVKVKTDDNENHVIKIEIRDLAGVERLQTSKVSYVIWMETDEGRIENLGQLNSSSGFMSKQLKASLETVSSYQPIKIFVTAEEFINAQYPGDEIVLTTERF